MRRPYASMPSRSQYLRSITFEFTITSKADSTSCHGSGRLAAMDERTCSTGCAALEIETPSWGYGNSGTRFHVFPWPGAARTVEERIADAGARPPPDGLLPERRAAHPLGCGRRLRGARAACRGPRACGSAPSTRTSSATTSTASAASAIRTRRSARERCDIAASASRSREQVGSTIISLWLADGTNYRGPGRPARPARAARAGPRRALRGAARRHAAARRVQVLRARVLQHRPARLGHRRAPLPASRPAGAGPRRHGPPPAGDERRADRGRASRPRGCSAASTSTTGSTRTTT